MPLPVEEGVCRIEKRQEQFHIFIDFSERPFSFAKKDTNFQYCEFHLIPRRPSSPEHEKNGIFTPEQGLRILYRFERGGAGLCGTV
jgi:hypothetical protein